MDSVKRKFNNKSLIFETKSEVRKTSQSLHNIKSYKLVLFRQFCALESQSRPKNGACRLHRV